MAGLPARALRYFAPSPSLRPYVTNLFVWTGQATAFEAWMPAIEAQIFIRIGGSGAIHFAGTPAQLLDRPMLVGPMTGTMHIATGNDLFAVGAGVTAAGYLKLIGAPAAALRDRATDLAAIWGERQVRWMVDLLAAARNHEARAGLLDTWLRTRIALDTRRQDWRAGVFDVWLAARAPVSLTTIQGDLGLSARQIDRLARDMLGLSPKTLLMRQRALRAAEGLAAGGSVAAAVEVLEYFDQSHMIRDFGRFIGRTPTSFLATDVARHVFAEPERVGVSLSHART